MVSINDDVAGYAGDEQGMRKDTTFTDSVLMS